MSAKKHMQEQILKLLKEVDGGATMAAEARANGVNVQTLYQWRKPYAGMSSSELPS